MFMRGCIHGFLFFLTCSCVLAQNAASPDPAWNAALNSSGPDDSLSAAKPDAAGPDASAAGPSVPEASSPDASAQVPPALPAPSVREKWNFFAKETVSPLMLVAAVPDATASQLTRSAPLYGKHFWRRDAFPKRLAATLGDNVSQNFFADFVLASAFHEDTRYVRQGSSHGMWHRLGYAISRSVIARTDAGDETFNWANVVGCAMSAGLSNAYYPPVSRTASVGVVNWTTNVAGAGLTNLMPEFSSDLSHWIKRHLPFHH
jgi:hypothetical protein